MKKLTRKEQRAIDRVEGKQSFSDKYRRRKRKKLSAFKKNTAARAFEELFKHAMREHDLTEEEILKVFTPVNLSKMPNKKEINALLKKYTGEAYDKHVANRINFFSNIYWDDKTETYRINEKDREKTHHRLATIEEMESFVGFLYDVKSEGEDKETMLNHMIVYIEQVLRQGHGNLKQSTPTLSKLLKAGEHQAKTRYNLK